MSTLRELIIKVSANSSSFQSEIARASRMGSDYYKTMEQGGKKAAAASRDTRRSLADLNSELASVKSSAISLTGAFAGAFATSELIRYADTWSQLSGRLRLASLDAGDFASSQRTLMDISQRTGTSFEANANLYARIASSLRDAGYASADVAKVTETVATSLKLSGASTEEASSVITQLSQALGSGVLRGEEFNSIMENGGRLAKLLASGLNTTVGGLRNMANNGQLTTDKLIPILTNVEQLRKEFETLPATVSGSAQKVQNAFMAWVGGANQASGASAALSGALDGVAGNIGNIAAAFGALAAVGAARVFGNMANSTATATGELVKNYKNQISLATAQTYAATQVQRKAVADAEAALSAYNLALAEANVAKGSNASALATENLIKKRSEMIAANARAIESNLAVKVSQEALNRTTSAVGLTLAGAKGLLSLVGGLPGVLMLGAGAWYTIYQYQEQARQSAQEYARQIDEIKDKTSKMSLTETDDNRGKTVDALVEQNRLINEQAKNVAGLKTQIDELNASRGKPGITSENDQNILKAIAIVTDQLAVEEGKLNNMREKSRDIQQALEQIERRRNDLIREQAWRQNAVYQSQLAMNGQHTEFNRLLSLGNNLLAARNRMVNVPLALPQMQVSDKDQQTLLAKQQQAELAGLTGLARVRKQADFDLDRMGRTGPENSTYAAQYRKAAEDEYNNTQKITAAKKAETDATRGAGKADREAAAQAEQYSRKMADLSVAVEVQKVRATEGEKASELYAASHQAGTRWTDEQRKAIRASSEELAKWTQKADENVRKQREQTEALKDLRDAARKYRDDAALISNTRGMGDRARNQYEERQQVYRVFDKTDGGTAAIAARDSALDALNRKYKESAAAEADWRSGAQKGIENWMDNASNYADQTANLVSNTMSGFVDTLSGALSGNKASWEDWSKSVLQSMQKIILNAMLVNSMQSLAGPGFLSFMGFGGKAAGAASGGGTFGAGAWNSAASGVSLNAKGGVYDSPSLSAFSNGIVRNPTMFAFAKGAGMMGEAGPEAIMPLTRAGDGSLGVRMVGGSGSGAGGNGSTVVHQTIHVSGNGDAALRQAMQDAARQGAQDGAKQARQEMLQDFQTRGQGRRLLGV